jgi:CRP-like cAMP-binding protein
MAIAYENLTAGQPLFHQGDCTRAIFVVISGQISLMHYTEVGRAIKHYEVRTGESFAEAALFNENWRTLWHDQGSTGAVNAIASGRMDRRWYSSKCDRALVYSNAADPVSP